MLQILISNQLNNKIPKGMNTPHQRYYELRLIHSGYAPAGSFYKKQKIKIIKTIQHVL